MMFFLLWKSGSPIRQTLFPSNFTSKEYSMNSQKLMLMFERIPPATPASSPDEREYWAPLTIGIWPSVVTVLGRCDVSDDMPMLGYGIGTGLGAGGAGVLQTSGKTIEMPLRPLW